MNLATVYQELGRTDEALAVIQEPYSWFQEGHETSDLRNARKFIGELSGISQNYQQLPQQKAS
jgi:hypothetical protein